MREFIRYGLFAWLALLSGISFSQSPTDSLLALLKTDKEDTGKVSHLCLLGKDQVLAGNLPEALSYSQQALNLAAKLNFRSGIARADNTIGVIYWNQGQYPKALEAFLTSLKIDEELGNKAGIAKSNNNIGLLYDEQSNYAEALNYYSKALKIHEEMNNKKGVATVLSNIGSAYYAQSDFPKALDYFSRTLQMTEELGDKVLQSNSLVNLGLIYYYTNDHAKALEYYFQAVPMFEELGSKKGLASVLGNIGQLYSKQKKYKDAEHYLLKAISISDSIDFLVGIKEFNEILSNVYEQTGETSKALVRYKQFTKAKDSLFNVQKNNDMTRNVMNYEFDKKEAVTQARHEKESEVAAAESRKQQTIIWAAVCGLLLVIVFSVFMFNRWRVTQAQKKIIEEQKFLVDEKSKIIEEKNKDITDSINYAKRIQVAILPPDKAVKEHLPECFTLYMPKDVVSGDFYFVERSGNKVVFASVDCTGHGVPGAMMSVVGFNYLSQAVNEKQLTKPSDILRFLDIGVNQTLRQSSGSGVSDGMDLSLCTLDKDTLELQYAGAYNPLWVIRKNKKDTCQEIGADKYPIGVNLDGKADEYTNHVLQLEKGDAIYLFTDGFADQFGGPKGKKFKYRQLEEKLLAMTEKPMEEQKKLLAAIFREWKGNLEQVDDVLVIGVRV